MDHVVKLIPLLLGPFYIAVMLRHHGWKQKLAL